MSRHSGHANMTATAPNAIHMGRGDRRGLVRWVRAIGGGGGAVSITSDLFMGSRERCTGAAGASAQNCRLVSMPYWSLMTT